MEAIKTFKLVSYFLLETNLTTGPKPEKSDGKLWKKLCFSEFKEKNGNLWGYILVRGICFCSLLFIPWIHVDFIGFFSAWGLNFIMIFNKTARPIRGEDNMRKKSCSTCFFQQKTTTNNDLPLFVWNPTYLRFRLLCWRPPEVSSSPVGFFHLWVNSRPHLGQARKNPWILPDAFCIWILNIRTAHCCLWHGSAGGRKEDVSILDSQQSTGPNGVEVALVVHGRPRHHL